MAATNIIIRESSSCKLKPRRYKPFFVVLCNRSKIHFTAFMNVKLGKHLQGELSLMMVVVATTETCRNIE